jgi:phenylacetate-CoA ligase
VDEFQVKATRHGELDELCIEIEVMDGACVETVSLAIAQSIRSTLGLRALVTAVPHGSLPRFELKAKRFHYFG